MTGTAEAHVVVSGRVQGVWFRGATVRFARDAGARGWVRNLPDRRVEAVVQGDRAAVLAVVDFMRTGPPGADVTGIEVSWRPRGEIFHDFDIRY
ncbi:MAG: acylphosphatase [Deltaproteobacteria bacterium]|nr:MAG: acylphosphatase [Deltaproteobacteria bacterium]